MFKETFQNSKYNTKPVILLAGFILGFLALAGLRFATYSPSHTHYHANFALVVNGEQETFESFSNYEELIACSADTTQEPSQRVHMHQPNNSVVHVHDEAVTWGHFFENIGMSVGADHVSTPTNLYTAEQNGEVSFILNGDEKRNIADSPISDEDRLLVIVGTESDSEALELYESTVPNNAAEFNESNDPGTCSSNESHGLSERFKHAF